jgi:hypothetical protein
MYCAHSDNVRYLPNISCRNIQADSYPSEVDINTCRICSLTPCAITLQMRLSWYIAAGTIVSSSHVALLSASRLFSTSFGYASAMASIHQRFPQESSHQFEITQNSTWKESTSAAPHSTSSRPLLAPRAATPRTHGTAQRLSTTPKPD